MRTCRQERCRCSGSYTEQKQTALKEKSRPKVARSYRIKARGCSAPLETGRYHLPLTSHDHKTPGSGTLSISPPSGSAWG